MQKDNFNNKLIRIGSRSSPLAIWQAKEVLNKIGKNSKVIKILTTGDQISDSRLAKYGGKGLFTRELDEAIEKNKIDIAVHSLKDVPTFIKKKFELFYILPRADVNDILMSTDNSKTIRSLPKNRSLGTSSPRRAAQIKRIREDLNIIPLRGNIGTRIEKLKKGKVDSIILALAGIKRLKIKEKFTPLKVKEFMPAVGQGIIVIQSLKKNDKINKILTKLENINVRHLAQAERATLKILRGDCNSSIAILSEIEKNILKLTARIFSSDGKRMIESRDEGDINESIAIGTSVGKKLIKKGGLEILNL